MIRTAMNSVGTSLYAEGMVDTVLSSVVVVAAVAVAVIVVVVVTTR